MRRRGWRLGGALCALMVSGQAAGAAEQPPERPADEATVEDGPPVSDDMIVDVMMRIERLVQRTAAVGAKRPSNAAVRAVARRLQLETGETLGRLRTYARGRGYPVAVAASTDPSEIEGERQLNAKLAELNALEPGRLNSVFLGIMHEICEQTIQLLDSAQEAAADPALRGLLRDRATTLQDDRRELRRLLLKQVQQEPAAAPTLE